MVVWQTEDGFRAEGNGEGCSGIISVSHAPNKDYQHYFDMKMDSAGNCSVLWSENLYAYGRGVWANRYDATLGRWGTPQQIWQPLSAPLGGTPGLLTLGIDGVGNVMAVWVELVFNFQMFFYDERVWASRFEVATGTWSIPLLLTPDTYRKGHLCIASAPNGNTIAMWKQGKQVTASSYDAVTDTWSSPVILQADPLVEGYPYQTVLDANGNGLAIWREGDTVWVNRFDGSSKSWGTSCLMNSWGWANATITLDGKALVLWCDTNWKSVYSTTYDISTDTWGLTEFVTEITSAYGRIFPINVVTNASGISATVLLREDSNGTSLWVSRYE
jgi:hypothetical protein